MYVQTLIQYPVLIFIVFNFDVTKLKLAIASENMFHLEAVVAGYIPLSLILFKS